MSSFYVRLHALACSVLIVVCSCGDSTGPKIEGTFALTSVGGESLPKPSMATSTDTIFADTITVSWPDGPGSDGRIDHRKVMRGPGGSLEVNSFAETIHMNGQTMVFVDPPCGGPFIDCFHAERSGSVAAGTLRITFTDPRYRPTIYTRF